MFGVGLPVAEQLRTTLSLRSTVILTGVLVREGATRLSTSVDTKEYNVMWNKSCCDNPSSLTFSTVPSCVEIPNTILKEGYAIACVVLHSILTLPIVHTGVGVTFICFCKKYNTNGNISTVGLEGRNQKKYSMLQNEVLLITKVKYSPLTLNLNVHAVVPEMGETLPLIALQVYSPASDSCTSERLRVDRVMVPSSPSDPPSSTVMFLLPGMFCRATPLFSQAISGGGVP